MSEELKPLPDAAIIINVELPLIRFGHIKPQPFYSAEQMQAYALENRRAQPEPAASADPLAGMSEMNRTIAYSAASKLREIGYEWTGKEWAAPSVAPEPVAWEGGEGWESLAWELCADENGEDACNELA